MRKKHRQSNLRSLHSGLIDTTSTIQAPKTKQRHYRLPPSSSNHEVADVFQYATSFYLVYAPIFDRSEERRVGKECRSRQWPEHDKKKNEDVCQLSSSW